ncbi:uncharacterized protein LOC127260311 [Andrographis paniculata]|uniref:uncharacterized protein LOC127243907 n=1 Tax=Andrographis paniculata TaxID=175694 RepID=UPI0021E75FFD|nr:uncharacterized protein LOC127243907 [Andrographis paniculata]XP_051134164.1 uncharacterized protein LOC127253559 [Andrographis paniculata]XP_051143988.1 uncharacterized protein LOC127260311 [Andrographis paniculata]
MGDRRVVKEKSEDMDEAEYKKINRKTMSAVRLTLWENVSTEFRFEAKGKGEDQEWSKLKPKNKDKEDASQVVYWNCKGHLKRQCRAPEKDQGSANATEEISDALILSVSSPMESWILVERHSTHAVIRESCNPIPQVILVLSILEMMRH